MPISIPQAFKDGGEQPHSSDPWVWFIEVELQRDFKIDSVTAGPALMLRVTSWHETTEWPLNDPLGHVVWEPLNFQFTPIEQTSEGDLPQLDLSVDNTAKTLMRYLHGGDGLEGNSVAVYLVPKSALTVAHPNHEFQRWDMQVAGVFANDDAITFRLERANFFTRLAPQDRFVASRCRWQYGSKECGYVLNNLAGYPTCPKTVDACSLRGEDHRSRGLAVVHPRRFGGFPGIPKQQ